MMRRFCVAGAAAAMILTGVVVAHGQNPTGAPPSLASAKASDDADTVEIGRPILVTMYKYVTEKVPVKVTVLVNGKPEERTEYQTVTKAVPETVAKLEMVSYPIRNLDIYDLKGKRLSREEVRRAMSDKT